MKQLFILCIILFLGQKAKAQDIEDVIYMKDGGIMRGIILEKSPGKGIKIQIGYRKTVFIKQEEIEKISREKVDEGATVLSAEPVKKGGYVSQFDIGLDKGRTHPNLDRLHINLINGYRFNEHFSLGAGLGLRFYTVPRDILIPLFVCAKYTVLNRRISPFLMLAAGYSFDSSNQDEEIKFEGIGRMINPSAGLRFILTRRSYVSMGIGYEIQDFNLSAASASYFTSVAARSSNTRTGAMSYHLTFGF